MSADYSGTSVPTLNNSPASSWATDAAKKSHVNDLYLVTGSGASAGNLYAFEEYAKPLVKNATPGEIVTFTDGGDNAPITSASVSLSPIQSLNGYDSPWPGGGGKNKLPTLSAATTLNGVTWTPNSNGTITANGTATANSVIDLGRGTLTLAAGTYTTNQSVSGKYDVNVFRLVNGSGVIHAQGGGTFTLTETASVFVRFAVPTGTTVNNVVIEPMLEAGTSKTAFAPYSNICPISGHTGATLYRTGKNLLDKANLLNMLFINTAQMKISPIGASGASVYCPIKGGETYTVSKMASARFTVGTTSALPAQNVAIKSFEVNSSGTQITIQTSESDKFLVVFFYLASADAGKTQSEILDTVQVELSSSPTAYEPYQGDTYSVTFTDQGTVYGGTYDFVTGKLRVTWASVTFNGSENWYTSGNNAYTPLNLFTKKSSYIGSIYCDKLATVYNNGGLAGTNYTITGYNDFTGNYAGQNWIYIKLDGTQQTSVDFKNWVSANNLQVVFVLATPLEYTLSPQQIETLLGENNVWGSGTITQLTYTSNQFTPSFNWFETWTVPKITRDNGTVIVLPKPQEYTPEIYDVDAATTGRNAAGTMIRDRVARKHKFNYKFAALSQQDTTEILNAVQDVSFTLTTASPETGAKTNYRVYVGDRSLPVYWMPTHAKASWMYSSLSLNLIEM